MRFGFHLSISKGLAGVVETAQKIGCEAVQFFVRNPRQWKERNFHREEIVKFREMREAAGLWPVVVHLSYLPNLASRDEALRAKSLKAFLHEWRTACAVGAEYLVFHPGHHHGLSLEAAHEAVAEAIVYVLQQVPPCEGRPMMLIENSAGQGTEVGSAFGELRRIRNRLGSLAVHVGYCVDTAHAAAAGYRFFTPDQLEDFVETLRFTLGLHRIPVLHLNDLCVPRSKRVDRHWHVGCGTIGAHALRRLIRHPALQHMAAILETPKKTDEDDVRNLVRVRNW